MSAGAHVCKVDKSAESGSPVSCSCGYAVGPFFTHSIAVAEADAHRDIHLAERQAARKLEKRQAAAE